MLKLGPHHAGLHLAVTFLSLWDNLASLPEPAVQHRGQSVNSLQHVLTPAVAQPLASFPVETLPLENLTEPFALGLNAISGSDAWKVTRN